MNTKRFKKSSKEWLDHAKAVIDPRVFQQEYEAVFIPKSEKKNESQDSQIRTPN